jgi:hypothetical protein
MRIPFTWYKSKIFATEEKVDAQPLQLIQIPNFGTGRESLWATSSPDPYSNPFLQAEKGYAHPIHLM